MPGERLLIKKGKSMPGERSLLQFDASFGLSLPIAEELIKTSTLERTVATQMTEAGGKNVGFENQCDMLLGRKQT